MHILDVFPMFIASLLEQNALFQSHIKVATLLASHHKIRLLVFLTYRHSLKQPQHHALGSEIILVMVAVNYTVYYLKFDCLLFNGRWELLLKQQFTVWIEIEFSQVQKVNLIYSDNTWNMPVELPQPSTGLQMVFNATCRLVGKY